MKGFILNYTQLLPAKQGIIFNKRGFYRIVTINTILLFLSFKMTGYNSPEAQCLFSLFPQRRDSLCVSRSDQRPSNVHPYKHDVHFPRRHDKKPLKQSRHNRQ